MPEKADWVEVTLAWWNMGDGDKDRKREAIIKVVRTYEIDVLALQEAADQGRTLIEAGKELGMGYWPGEPGVAGAASTPFLIADDIPVDRRHTKVATHGQRIGPAGAGPDHAKQKVINRVRVYRCITVINNHLLPSIVQDHLANTAIRRRLVRIYITDLVEILRHIRKAAASGGDHNAPAGFFLLRRLGFMKQVVKAPTHEKRTIDLVYLLRCKDVWVEVVGMPSDHDMVIVKVRYRRKAQK